MKLKYLITILFLFVLIGCNSSSTNKVSSELETTPDTTATTDEEEGFDLEASQTIQQELNDTLETILAQLPSKYQVGEILYVNHAMELYTYLEDGVLIDDYTGVYNRNTAGSLNNRIFALGHETYTQALYFDDQSFRVSDINYFPRKLNFLKDVDDSFEFSKENNVYQIKVKGSDLIDLRFNTVFTSFYFDLEYNRLYREEELTITIQINEDENEIIFFLKDSENQTFAEAFWRRNSSIGDFNYQDYHQTKSSTISAAISPMKLNEEYFVKYNEMDRGYNNYYKLQLEAGSYALYEDIVYDQITFVDERDNEIPIDKEYLINYDKGFAFTLEADQVIYLKIKDLWNADYKLKLSKIERSGYESIPLTLGQEMTITVNDIYDGYQIVTNEINKNYKIEFKPLDMLGLIIVGNAFYYTDGDAVYYYTVTNQTFNLKVNSSAILTITELFDDSFPTTKEEPYPITTDYNETFVTSSLYDNDYFTFETDAELTHVSVTNDVYFEIYNEKDQLVNNPVKEPGQYLVKVLESYDYKTYQIKYELYNSKTINITEPTYQFEENYFPGTTYTFEFTLEEKNMIHLKMNDRYGFTLYEVSSEKVELIKELEEYYLTLNPGTYHVVYTSYGPSTVSFEFENLGISTKYAFNDQTRHVLPQSNNINANLKLNLVFDYDLEIIKIPINLGNKSSFMVEGNIEFYLLLHNRLESYQTDTYLSYNDNKEYEVVLMKDNQYQVTVRFYPY
jgi:hypothetical protein